MKNEIGKQIGQIVKKYRKERQLSQRSFEMTSSYMSRLESGEFLNPGVNAILSIADDLGLGYAYLINEAIKLKNKGKY